MSKRRISNREVTQIGEERIARLMDLSVEALRSGKPDRARRYVEIARRIGMKTRVTMPKDRRFCKGCLVPLVPGLSCTVRLNGGLMSTTCTLCGKVRRIPYTKERMK
jgi:ribonuclease P protein subunit RPR2